MLGVDYDDKQYAVYARGRALTPELLEIIVSALARNLPERRPLVVADVGAGVGRLTPSIAVEFGGPVYGIEPAAKMRAQALIDASHPRVEYLAGCADSIPLPDASCDALVMWFVWHHVTNHAASATELRRVARPGGRLLLRMNCSDSDGRELQWWAKHFPAAQAIHSTRTQSRAELVECFESGGWQYVGTDDVPRVSTYGRDIEMLRLRAISTLEVLPDEVFAEGVANAEREARGREDETVTSPGSLYVFENPAFRDES